MFKIHLKRGSFMGVRTNKLTMMHRRDHTFALVSRYIGASDTQAMPDVMHQGQSNRKYFTINT